MKESVGHEAWPNTKRKVTGGKATVGGNSAFPELVKRKDEDVTKEGGGAV